MYGIIVFVCSQRNYYKNILNFNPTCRLILILKRKFFPYRLRQRNAHIFI